MDARNGGIEGCINDHNPRLVLGVNLVCIGYDLVYMGIIVSHSGYVEPSSSSLYLACCSSIHCHLLQQSLAAVCSSVLLDCKLYCFSFHNYFSLHRFLRRRCMLSTASVLFDV